MLTLGNKTVDANKLVTQNAKERYCTGACLGFRIHNHGMLPTFKPHSFPDVNHVFLKIHITVDIQRKDFAPAQARIQHDGRTQFMLGAGDQAALIIRNGPVCASGALRQDCLNRWVVEDQAVNDCILENSAHSIAHMYEYDISAMPSFKSDKFIPQIGQVHGD